MLVLDATQILSNKSVEGLILQDSADNTKKINFTVANQNTLSNEGFQFPGTNDLNNSGATNTLVTALATQTLSNKTLSNPIVTSPTNADGSVIFSTDNLLVREPSDSLMLMQPFSLPRT